MRTRLGLKNLLYKKNTMLLQCRFSYKLPASSDKFQCVMLSRNGGVSIPLSVHNNILYPTDEIKVLGVTLDDSLNFKSHVTDICNRASRQINSFKRFAKYLKIDRRLSVYKSLSKAISHTVHWLGSFVEGKIAISLKNYRNVPFALFLMTFQRVMKFCAKGLTLCLFHSIVFVSWA